MRKVNFLFLFRILIGGIFIISGAEKLFSPYQNFQYVIESYQIFPPVLEKLFAQILPWIECLTGVFIVIGLCLKNALRALLLMIMGFIIIVGQAIARGLSIDECGCFGEFISFTLPQVILFDSCLFVIVCCLIVFYSKAKSLSLDGYFEKN